MVCQPTVFVIDDDAAVRDSLRCLIGSAGFGVQTHRTAQDFLDTYDSSIPGCLLVDIHLPGMSGFELQDHIAREEPAPPIIVITGHGDVPSAVRALKHGAMDFIEKPFDDRVLLDRVREAIALDARNRSEHMQRCVLLNRARRLTRREREVMNLVVRGLPNKAIASRLFVSQKTVEAHRASAMRKMEAHSLPELVRFAEIVGRDGGAALPPAADRTADQQTDETCPGTP